MANTSGYDKMYLRCGIESRGLDRRTQEGMGELASPVIHMSRPRLTSLSCEHILSPGHGKGPEVRDVCGRIKAQLESKIA